MKELIKGINPIDTLIELNGMEISGGSIKMDLSCNNPCPQPPRKYHSGSGPMCCD